MHAWRNAASTKSITAGTEICAATVRCRTLVLASALSAPSPTSRASPMCATRFPSRERPEMPSIDAQGFVIAENDGEVVQQLAQTNRAQRCLVSGERRTWADLLRCRCGKVEAS